jgi:hypothetical protein
MVRALFLGGPLHCQTREFDRARDRLSMVYEVEPQQRGSNPFGGGSWRPAVTHAHPYHRVPIPESDAVVYVADGYEPTPEDVEFVWGWVRG